MTFKVVFLKSAEHDLRELKNYLVKNFGKDTWQASYARIKKSVQSIKTFPKGGNVPEALEHLGLAQYRHVVSDKNRIIYEINPTENYLHSHYW